ncbi:MAG: S49 family peptidase [Mucinivorans sp.]
MIKNIHLINAIFNEPWLISVANHRDQINALLTGALSSEFEVENIEPDPSEMNGSVAIISISGVLTKNSGACGALGMDDYSRQITSAIDDQSVDAIVLKIYSPGGMVNGTDGLSQIIKNSTKPIVAFVDDQACSGAYWLASSCREIIANNEIATVGSIGVMAVYNDLTKANEKAGVTEHLIFARQSTHKWREHREVLAGNYATVEDQLSVIADHFISHVKSQRPSVADDLLTGDVYFASQVVGTLIDQIGTIDVAIERALFLAQTSKTNKMAKTETKTTALALAAGVDAFESDHGSISLNKDQIASVEAALNSAAEFRATQSAAAESTSARIAELEKELATAQSTAAASATTLTELQAKLAGLDGQAGAPPATSNPALDGQASISTDRALDFAKSMNSARTFLN